MTLQGTPSDVHIITPFCREIYRRCRAVGGEYEDVGRDAFALHAILKQVKREIEKPDSFINSDLTVWSRKLVPILNDSNSTLTQLNLNVQQRERRLSNESSAPKPPAKPVLDRQNTLLSLGGKDQLVAVKAKLLSQKTSLALLLETIKLHSARAKLAESGNQSVDLDKILDEVDNIAAKLAKQQLISNADANVERPLWKRIRDQLEDQGFAYDLLQQHKDVLKAYIRELDQDKRVKDSQKNVLEQFSIFNQDRPHTPPSSTSEEDVSPRAVSSSFKETISDQRPSKPRAQTDFQIPRLMREHASLSREDARYTAPLKIPSAMQASSDYYMLITPEMFADDSAHHSMDQSSPADDLLDSATLKPIQSEVIETSDLATKKMPVLTSPTLECLEQPSYFDNQDSNKLAPEGNMFDLEMPPAETEAAVTAESRVKLGRSKSVNDKSGKRKKVRLAPDSQGQPIPKDAKWTKIKRSLVSPEVLRQEDKRFEANPEFVAVLGQLTREEIQEYAVRSLALREARWARPRPQMSYAYTYQVPRPSPISPPTDSQTPQTPSTPPNQKLWPGGHTMPSPEGNSDSDPDREQNINNIRSAFLRQSAQHQTYSGSSPNSRRTSTQSTLGYPNTYGSPARSRYASTGISPTPSTGASKSPPLSATVPPPGLGDRSMSSMSLGKTNARSNTVTFAEEVTIQTSEELDRAGEAARRREGKEIDLPERGLRRWKTTYKEQGIGGTAIKLVNKITDVAGI